MPRATRPLAPPKKSVKAASVRVRSCACPAVACARALWGRAGREPASEKHVTHTSEPGPRAHMHRGPPHPHHIPRCHLRVPMRISFPGALHASPRRKGANRLKESENGSREGHHASGHRSERHALAFQIVILVLAEGAESADLVPRWMMISALAMDCGKKGVGGEGVDVETAGGGERGGQAIFRGGGLCRTLAPPLLFSPSNSLTANAPS